MPNPVAVAIELSDDERAQLEAWARRRTSAQALADCVVGGRAQEHRDRCAARYLAKDGDDVAGALC
jgi:hypothetical protein